MRAHEPACKGNAFASVDHVFCILRDSFFTTEQHTSPHLSSIQTYMDISKIAPLEEEERLSPILTIVHPYPVMLRDSSPEKEGTTLHLTIMRPHIGMLRNSPPEEEGTSPHPTCP